MNVLDKYAHKKANEKRTNTVSTKLSDEEYHRFLDYIGEIGLTTAEAIRLLIVEELKSDTIDGLTLENEINQVKKMFALNMMNFFRRQEEIRSHLDSVLPSIKWDELTMLDGAVEVVLRCLLSVEIPPCDDDFRDWKEELKGYCYEDFEEEELIQLLDEILAHSPFQQKKE